MISGFLNVLGGRHPIEKVGERWCDGWESSGGPRVNAVERQDGKNKMLKNCRVESIH
jgi:hypothetical protein